MFLREGYTANFCLRTFHEIQFQGHFLNHQILSWNIFTLVSQWHCICSHQYKNCVYREKISSDSENLIALILINNICCPKQKQKNQKRPKRIWIKPLLKKQEPQKACVSLFSELLLTDKFQHYLRMNAISYYWSYNYFYILITFHILYYTYNNTVCIDYFDASTVHVFHFTNNFFSITQLKQ